MAPRPSAREKSSPLVRLISGDGVRPPRKGCSGVQNLPANQGLAIAVRVVAAVAGGYAVASGLAALAAVALPAARLMARSEAVVLASMLAFPVYLALLIWAFADRRLGRLCLALAVAGAASWGGALALTRS